MAKKPAATLGDMHSCPIKGHGTTPIVSGSGQTLNGKPIALVGDTTGCGATIIEGAPVMMANGKLVAFLGSKTSHGGTIISGDSGLILDTAMGSVVGGLDKGVAELLKKNFYKKTLLLKDANGSPLKDCPYCIEGKDGSIIASGITDSSGSIKDLDSGDKEDTYRVSVGFDALLKQIEEI
jgi:uncharacterized Zn-binding protein involved in type VI secretion